MKPLRACPICPKCGSKKFEKLDGPRLRVKCKGCKKIIEL